MVFKTVVAATHTVTLHLLCAWEGVPGVAGPHWAAHPECQACL
jgi:hypothetical protein